MSGLKVLRAAQQQTVRCGLPGCTTPLPVKVSCTPRSGFDDTYAVMVVADPEALRRHLRDMHWPTHRPTLRTIR